MKNKGKKNSIIFTMVNKSMVYKNAYDWKLKLPLIETAAFLPDGPNFCA
jgi:hypothetical protein